MKQLRIYIDTSVIGGCFDEEYERESLALLKMANEGKVMLLISDILADELELAPEEVQEKLTELPIECFETLIHSWETERLRDGYLKAGVVGVKHTNDAHHVAIATVAKADVIVSWNFRHIVHFDKIRGFNAVNLREGYGPIEIRSPREVV
jgi:predicted nucleic acid-binding protein